MSEAQFYSLFFFLIGAVLSLEAISNWEYFFSQRKAKWLIEKLGRRGARLVYGALGMIFISVAVSLSIGILKL